MELGSQHQLVLGDSLLGSTEEIPFEGLSLEEIQTAIAKGVETVVVTDTTAVGEVKREEAWTETAPPAYQKIPMQPVIEHESIKEEECSVRADSDSFETSFTTALVVQNPKEEEVKPEENQPFRLTTCLYLKTPQCKLLKMVPFCRDNYMSRIKM